VTTARPNRPGLPCRYSSSDDELIQLLLREQQPQIPRALHPGAQQARPQQGQPQQPQARLSAPGAAAARASGGGSSSPPLVQLQAGASSSSSGSLAGGLPQASSSSSALRCAFEAGALPPGLQLLKDDSCPILLPGPKLPPCAPSQAPQEELLGTEAQDSTPRAQRIARLLYQCSISTHPLIWQLATHGSGQAQSLGQALRQGGAAKAKQLALAMVHLAGQLQELATLQELDEAAGAAAARSESSTGAAARKGPAGSQQQQQQLPVLPLV
jgi:hypothetical protein